MLLNVQYLLYHKSKHYETTLMHPYNDIYQECKGEGLAMILLLDSQYRSTFTILATKCWIIN
jgi:hypothetical protein